MNAAPRRFVPALAAAVAVLALSSLGGTTAGASDAAKRGSCPNVVCVWSGLKGAGQEVQLSKLGISNKLARKMNNDATSIINDTEGAVFLYNKKDAEGSYICIEPKSNSADLSEFNFNDKASSSKLTQKNHCPV